MTRKQKSTFWTVIGVTLAVLAIVAIVSLATRVNKLETTKTVGSFMTYDIGKLDDTTGKPYKKADIDDVEDYDEWIHLKEYINADGLKCKLAENAKIAYQVNFYDEDYEFLGKVDCTTDYDISKETNPVLASAKYVIIEITPTSDPDGVVSTFEIMKYAKMLEVTYNK